MPDERTLALYEAQADRYEALPMVAALERAFDRFIETLPKSALVMDLGCGPGLQAARMAEAGHRVAAIDATPAFVDAARQKGIDARLGSFDDLSERTVYDGVWASFSLLHAPREDLPRHLKAVTTALKPRGLFFAAMKLGRGEVRDDFGRYYTYVTEGELCQLVAASGMTVTRVETGEGVGLAGHVDPFVMLTARAAASASGHPGAA